MADYPLAYDRIFETDLKQYRVRLLIIGEAGHDLARRR
jgi:hypothetical protein